MFSLSPVRIGGGVSMVTSSLGPNDPKVGDRCVVGNESYLFVYNIGSSTLSTGFACVVSALSGYSVTISSTTSADFAIGFCKHADIATGSYGWVVTQGFCSAVAVSTSGTVVTGGPFYLAADGKVAPASGNSAGNGLIIGKAMATFISGASGPVYVNCI